MTIEFMGTLVPERGAGGRVRRLQSTEVAVQQEDSGQSWIAEFAGNHDEGMFVRLHSWDSQGWHSEMASMVHKRLRITVEVLEYVADQTD